jgi:hypothetical protein
LVTVKILQHNIFYLSATVNLQIVSLMTIGKPEAATAVVVAPDNGHEDARNMLSCI